MIYSVFAIGTNEAGQNFEQEAHYQVYTQAGKTAFEWSKEHFVSMITSGERKDIYLNGVAVYSTRSYTDDFYDNNIPCTIPLAFGVVRGLRFYIASRCGMYPVIYVQIPNIKMVSKERITYVRDKYEAYPILLQWDLAHDYLRWDHGHICDYQNYTGIVFDGKKWTIDEVYAEVVKVCKILNPLNKSV